MEQQKLLWTILSVGILVLIILGAGMFFFLPSDSTGLAQNGKTTEWSKATAQVPAPEQKAPEVKKTPTQPASPAPAPKPEIKKTPVQTTQSPAPAPKPVPTPKPEVKKETPKPEEKNYMPIYSQEELDELDAEEEEYEEDSYDDYEEYDDDSYYE